VPHHLEDHAVALGLASPKDDATVGCYKVHGPECRVLVPDALDHLVVDELLAIHEVGAVLERQQPLVIVPTCRAPCRLTREVRRRCLVVHATVGEYSAFAVPWEGCRRGPWAPAWSCRRSGPRPPPPPPPPPFFPVRDQSAPQFRASRSQNTSA